MQTENLKLTLMFRDTPLVLYKTDYYAFKLLGYLDRDGVTEVVGELYDNDYIDGEYRSLNVYMVIGKLTNFTIEQVLY